MNVIMFHQGENEFVSQCSTTPFSHMQKAMTECESGAVILVFKNKKLYGQMHKTELGEVRLHINVDDKKYGSFSYHTNSEHAKLRLQKTCLSAIVLDENIIPIW